MLKSVESGSSHGEGAESIAGDRFVPFEVLSGDYGKGLVLVCDHARNAFPPEYGTLGLAPEQLEQHIAYDIGVEAVTRELAAALGVPAAICLYSRLLIDPNRGDDDPTLIMRISDGVTIPGNVNLDAKERQRRLDRFHLPYHEAVGETVDRAMATGREPAILSIHSFTPNWRGYERIWHVGVLWDSDERFSRPLVEALEAEEDLTVGENEPYSGELEGDCMYRHGTNRGLRHALLEIRQDLISDRAGINVWAERLSRIVPPIVERFNDEPVTTAGT